MRYGDTWPIGRQSGGPAITTPTQRPMARMERYTGKWARLWLASHPGCQHHPECQRGAQERAS